MNLRLGISLFLIVTFSCCALVFIRGCRSKLAVATGIDRSVPRADWTTLLSKASEAEKFVVKKSYNPTYCLLADMGLHSGVKRLFLWDFKRDTIAQAFMLSHGCGKKIWSLDLSKQDPVFSNTDGSHCSSLGKYKIGERGVSQWGIKVKYLLHGLDSSNSNALRRAIVLHSWEEITDDETYPDGTAEGWGCPAVSDNSLSILDTYLKASEKPVLLWMFDSRNGGSE